jgi:tetratricopeptide (TPR) repeat protein
MYNGGAYYDLSLFGKPVLAQGKAWCLRYSRKVRMMTPADKIYADWLYALYFQTPYDRIKYLDQLKEIDDQNPATYFNLGDAHLEMLQYNEAIVEFKKAIEIYDKWGEKAPIMYYQELGIEYRRAGRYKEEKKLYRKAKKYYPDAPDLLNNMLTWHSVKEIRLKGTVILKNGLRSERDNLGPMQI